MWRVRGFVVVHAPHPAIHAISIQAEMSEVPEIHANDSQVHVSAATRTDSTYIWRVNTLS
jgi:hypothetical protein